MKTEVLLFNPPAPDGQGYTREGRCTQEAGAWGTQWPPLTLATTAALLRQEGRRVVVRDYSALGWGVEALRGDLQAMALDFAIWSTGTPTLGSDLALAAMIREARPEALTAVLGTHVAALPEEALAEPALQAVIRGEPEGVIACLCRHGKDLAQVAGLSWRGRDGLIRHNPDAEPLGPDAIPAPDWTGLDLGRYRLPLKGRRFLIVAPVRGCPWQCTFCTAPLYYGRRLRRRPVDSVVAEIAAGVARFGVRDFFVWADTFTADRAYVRDFCRALLAAGLRVDWTCNSRVDTIDAETLALMKEAGLWMISYGIESASEAVLAACGKGITAAQSRDAVVMAHRLGIRTAGHFIFGLPGETAATMAGTLDFALSLPLDLAQFYAASPFPGTALYEEAVTRGWLAVSAAGCSQAGAALSLPGLSAAQVDEFRRHAFRRFYLRPAAAARLLTMAEPAFLLGLAAPLRFLNWTR